MRNIFGKEVEDGRVIVGDYASKPGVRWGKFKLKCPTTGRWLTIVAYDGSGWEEQGLAGPAWEHVSVSCQTTCPDWVEMKWSCRLFFRDDEWCVQYHPAEKDYIDNTRTVLHIWRLRDGVFPTPPPECV